MSATPLRHRTPATGADTTLSAGTRTLTRRLRERLAERRERRRARALHAELERFSDHLLRDVGWSRNGALDRADGTRTWVGSPPGETLAERTREASGVSPRATAALARLPAPAARAADPTTPAVRGARAA